jgi:hypothetical protein
MSAAARPTAKKARSNGSGHSIVVPAGWVAAGLIAIALFVVAQVLPDSPSAIAISASVRHTGEMSLLFDGKSTDATSPACGCARQHPIGGWRGIVFPAQNLSIQRSGTAARGATQYDLSSADPATIDALPQLLGLTYSVSFIAVPPNVTNRDPTRLPPDQRVALQGPAPTVRSDWVSAIVNGSLHVSSRSAEPVAAFIPPTDRRVTISYRTDGSRLRGRALKLSTSFNLDAGRGTADYVNGLAVVDVLGPRVVLWGDISKVKVPVMLSSWHRPFPTAGVGATTQVRADRIGILPRRRAPKGWIPQILLETRAPMFAARLAIRPALLDRKPEVFSAVGSGDGKLELSVPNIARSSRTLVRAFEAADRDPRLRIGGLRMIPPQGTGAVPTPPGMLQFGQYNRGALQFEYPPTPPESGINIFGPISDLRFAAATADLTVETEPREIRAPTPIELRDIRGRGVLGHHMVVPVRADGSDAQIHVTGEADTRINGQPLATERSWVADVLSKDSLSWFFGIASALSIGNGIRLQLKRSG